MMHSERGELDDGIVEDGYLIDCVAVCNCNVNWLDQGSNKSRATSRYS